jgi:hypothetical protein
MDNVTQAIKSAKSQPWGRVIEVTPLQRLQDQRRGAKPLRDFGASPGLTLCVSEDDGVVLRYAIAGVFDAHPSTIEGCQWNGYRWTF